MRKFIALIITFTMVCSFMLSIPTTAMPDATPGVENPDWLWDTVRLEHGTFTRESSSPQGRALLFIDGGGGGGMAIRESWLRFEFDDFITRSANGDINIEELRLKINLNEVVTHLPIGIYVMPPRMASFDYRTLDGVGVQEVIYGGVSTMRNDVTYLVGQFTPRLSGPLLTGDIWPGVQAFLERYPNETGITIRLSKLYTFFNPNGTAITNQGSRTTISFRGMTRLPGEPILRFGYIDDAIRRVNAAISEFNMINTTNDEDSQNVTRPRIWPTTWHNGVAISWHSSSPSVIDPTTGVVNRPAFGTGDRDVTLTATFSYERAPNVYHTEQLTFDLTVLAYRANPAHAGFTIPTYLLSFGPTVFTLNADVSNILNNASNIDSAWLRLVPINRFNVGDEVNITIDGVSFIGQLDDSGSIYLGDILPALVAAGNNTTVISVYPALRFRAPFINVTYDLRPAIIAPTRQDAVNMTADFITAEAIDAFDVNRVRGDLNLFTSWRYNATISWESSRHDIIDPLTGELTRPDEDTPVTLTATVTSGGVSTTVTINVIAFGLNSDRAHFEYLFDNLTFPRMVETNNFTLPTVIPGTQFALTWVSENPRLAAVSSGSGDFVNVSITRPGHSDQDAILTATIDDGAIVSRDFHFTIVRRGGHNLFFNRNVIDDDANNTKRAAIHENLDFTWQINGNDRTISIDTQRSRAFSEFLVVFEGAETTGLRIYSSENANTWTNIFTSGVILPNKANLFVWESPISARYVRFVFPANVDAVNFIGGFAPAEGMINHQMIFDLITVPDRITADFALDTEFFDIPVVWRSSRPAVVRIDGDRARFTLTDTLDNFVTLTATVNIGGNVRSISFERPFDTLYRNDIGVTLETIYDLDELSFETSLPNGMVVQPIISIFGANDRFIGFYLPDQVVVENEMITFDMPPLVGTLDGATHGQIKLFNNLAEMVPLDNPLRFR
ncbi:MAG: discoidin domain-containing protein [Oscillospiraceae bacterium]|nr:discoidin domain-containing protein [Oscillospiraceae bacterium]